MHSVPQTCPNKTQYRNEPSAIPWAGVAGRSKVDSRGSDDIGGWEAATRRATVLPS